VNKQLTFRTLLFFAGPSMILGLTGTASGSILAGVYAKNFDISLTALGTAMLMARLFDAISDPLIGYLSDRTRSRLGPRKPWVALGLLLTVISTFYYFIPPESADATYFMIWYMAATLSWTMVQIPLLAWQGELSHDYHERSRISTYRVVGDRIGRFSFALLPLLPIFASTRITLEVMESVFWLVLILAPITLVFSMWKVPRGTRLQSAENDRLIDFIKTIPRNKPMILLVIITVLGGLADGVFSTTVFLYIDVYLQRAEDFPKVLLVGQGFMLMALPVCLVMMRRFGKHPTWAGGTVFMIFGCLTLLLTGPGDPLWSLLFAVLLVYAGAAAGNVASTAMLADVVDYDTLKTGHNRGGQYFSLAALIEKANFAVGGAIAFYTLDLFGFDVKLSVQSVMGDWGMKTTIGILPIVLSALAMILLIFYPLTEARHNIVRRRLEQRRDRHQTIDET
jgi:GPH family glycoside/pentoside/hexuronide:cation symporter